MSGTYLAGILSRDPTGSLLSGIEGNAIVRNVLGAPFDAVDIALNYQGIPSATGWEIALSHNAQNVIGAQSIGFGHSLSALEYSTLVGLGVLIGGAVAALPLGSVAPTGVPAYLGTSDLVNGSYLGKIFNWGATMVHERAFSLLNPFAGHDLRNNYLPHMPAPEGGGY